MKRKIIIVLLLSLFFSTAASFASNATDIKVFGNDLMLEVKAIKQGNEYYVKIDNISRYLNYHIRWYNNQKSCFILDYNNWRSGTIAVDSNYINISTYEDKMKEDTSGIGIMLEKIESKYLKLNKPLIAYNNGYYISVNYLKNHMKAQIEVKDNTILLTYIDNSLSVDEFYREQASYIDANESFVEYFLEEIHSKENTLNSDNSIVDIYKLKLADTLINTTVWINSTHFDKSDFIHIENGKDYNESIKRYTQVKIIELDSEKYSYIVQIGKIKYLLDINTFFNYLDEKENYPYVILNKDPKKVFKWSATTWSKMDKYDYWTGMTPDMAYMTMGKPDDINNSVGSWGKIEQWVYEYTNYDNTYLYFKNGILTSWQD